MLLLKYRTKFYKQLLQHKLLFSYEKHHILLFITQHKNKSFILMMKNRPLYKNTYLKAVYCTLYLAK